MGLFKGREEKAVGLFEKQYKNELRQMFSLKTGQGVKPTEMTLRMTHQQAVKRVLGDLSGRGYHGLDEAAFRKAYWPVAQSMYPGLPEG